MTFESFANLINEEIEKELMDNESCKIKKVLKNNGLEMTGIYFIQENVNISPTIYLDEFYKEYIDNKLTVREIITEIKRIYDESKFNKSIDLRDFFEYKNMKDRVIFKLINVQRNEEFLRDIPHIKFHDLAIIFMALIADDKMGSATITINNSHLQIWNITKEDLYRDAIINTPELRKPEIKTMKSILAEMAGLRDEDYLGYLEGLEEITPMYVLSNRNRVAGAACILYPNLLKKLANAIEKDFYIIPSSIHEVIIIPILDGNEHYGLCEIIKEVNENEIPVEEVLSDSLYIYRHDIDKIELVEINDIE